MYYMLDCGHSRLTSGKHSPDKKFYEYEYNRIIGRMVAEQLERLNIQFGFTYDLDADKDLGRSKRAEAANKVARQLGAKNVLLISIHSNAAGNEGKWMKARGWSVYTTVGKTKSDEYAEVFYEEAVRICEPKGLSVRKDTSDGDHDWEADFTVIKKTICPSILIEEFFYDNREEMEWLLSDDGKRTCTDIIVSAIKRIEGIKQQAKLSIKRSNEIASTEKQQSV